MKSLVNRLGIAVAFAFVLLPKGMALEPFECALLVNADSQQSKEVANYYAEIRDMPPENIIRLSLPEKVLAPPYKITVEEFQKYIRGPVVETLDERGLSKRVLAWIYSVDFPIRIAGEGGVTLSLQGATLAGANLPAKKDIEKAKYVSPLYRGPGPLQKQLQKSRSLDRLLAADQVGGVVPSMMLSFTRSRGLSIEETKDLLKRGVMADGSNPRGTVYFVKTDDPHRSKPRHWQFDPARKLLLKSGVKAEVVEEFPRNRKGIIGLQTGNKSVSPKSAGVYSPGAMAEHLTSWSACFDIPWHTKATEWLAAGATTSSGTVTEPFALWPKFPTAFFFYHYRSGCTALESYFQSVRSPMQLLMLGDPLARPWMQMVDITIVTLDDGPQSGTATFFARVFPKLRKSLKPELNFYLDGRKIMTGMRKGQCQVDTTKIADGYHRLRVVLETSAEVNIQPSSQKGFVVDNKGRIPQLKGIEEGAEVDLRHSFAIQVVAPGEPETVGVRSRNVVLDEHAPNGEGLQIDPTVVGCGKVPLQAFATYSDGMTALSRPVHIQIARRNSLPESVNVAEEDGGNVLRVTVNDAEGDSLRYSWYKQLLRSVDALERNLSVTAGSLNWKDSVLEVKPVKTNAYDLCLWGANRWKGENMAIEMALRSGETGYPKSGKAGLIFGVEDSDNFGFFGFYADISAWVLGYCENGKLRVADKVGANLDIGTWNWMEVEIDLDSEKVSARIDGESVLEMPLGNISVQGKLGLFSSKREAFFRNLLFGIPGEEESGISTEADKRSLAVRVSDGCEAGYFDLMGERL